MSILKVDEIQDTAGKKILQNTGGVLQVVSANGGEQRRYFYRQHFYRY